MLTQRRSSNTSPSPAASPALPLPLPLPPPLPMHPPTKALLAAFAGDLPAALLSESYYRAQQFVSLHSDRISPELHDLLQVRHGVAAAVHLTMWHVTAARRLAFVQQFFCLCLQGLSAKVVQGQAGGRADIALVAQCMSLAEVAYACPAWQDWRQSGGAGARYVRFDLLELLARAPCACA